MILYCYNLFYVTVESLVLGPLIKFIIALHSCIGRDRVFRYSTEFWKCYLCGQGRLLPQTDYDQVTGICYGSSHAAQVNKTDIFVTLKRSHRHWNRGKEESGGFNKETINYDSDNLKFLKICFCPYKEIWIYVLVRNIIKFTNQSSRQNTLATLAFSAPVRGGILYECTPASSSHHSSSEESKHSLTICKEVGEPA